MPIYEYECDECGQITEELQGFNDKPLKKCKSCKGKLRRIISLSSFQLTGHGWYSTDYAKGPGIPPKAAEQDNPALSGEAKNGDAKDAPSTAASAETITTDPKKIKKSGMANMSKSASKG